MWEEKRAIYDRLIKMSPEIQRKGKTVPYTSSNGHMFSQLNKDGEIGIRLPKESQKKFMEEFQATTFTSYGAVMRGYVKIPEELLDNLELVVKYLEEGYAYVNSLPPGNSKK